MKKHIATWPSFLLITVFTVLLTVSLGANINPFESVLDYGHFFFLGLMGAIVANSTGSGGGVVFIPSFNSLGFTHVEALGTSILIQCFGMTVGSIRWLTAAYKPSESAQHKQLLGKILLIAAVPTIAGMLLGQYVMIPPEEYSVVVIFRYFSIFFGIVLLYNTLFRNEKGVHTRQHLRSQDAGLLLLVCFIGGLITAWISVGVGELVALLLIFLRYPTMIAVAVGVCMSSVACLAGSTQHAVILQSVNWNVILFAAPAAMIGGAVARSLAVRLGPARLKVFFGVWILATGVVMES